MPSRTEAALLALVVSIGVATGATTPGFVRAGKVQVKVEGLGLPAKIIDVEMPASSGLPR